MMMIAAGLVDDPTQIAAPRRARARAPRLRSIVGSIRSVFEN